MERITRDELNFSFAQLVAQRSTCGRAAVGAILVQEGRVVTTGYNGAPSGIPHCLDTGCVLGDNGGCSLSVHAEANCIAFAAKHGISTWGATLYCTHQPCLECSKLIINCGIKRVYYLLNYRDDRGSKLLTQAGVEIRKVNVE